MLKIQGRNTCLEQVWKAIEENVKQWLSTSHQNQLKIILYSEVYTSPHHKYTPRFWTIREDILVNWLTQVWCLFLLSKHIFVSGHFLMSTTFERHIIVCFLCCFSGSLGQLTIQNPSLKCTMLTATCQIIRLSCCAGIMWRFPLAFHNTSVDAALSGRMFEFKIYCQIYDNREYFMSLIHISLGRKALRTLAVEMQYWCFVERHLTSAPLWQTLWLIFSALWELHMWSGMTQKLRYP